MATIKFIEFDGTEHVVEGANDSSIMEAAVTNLVPDDVIVEENVLAQHVMF